ncbi:polysaccharide deacetylase [Clostridium sp. FP2]|uniref:polysaccharide deacetylase family protein n=1 Tax=Clostridium sp. FP2 TaxID=2724481 RepID=UPI0013E91DA7|nr:polysaccharide deacetylase family protein [Clostridium sp. FP2]MBZ9624080.1 polysaccharide deacetylase [Clostridium sp. FP2]
MLIILSLILYSSKVKIKTLKTSLSYEINTNKQLEISTKILKLSIIELQTNVNDLNKTINTLVVGTKPIANTLKTGEKEVYLTFDDGPSENTSKVLEILKDNDVNATFFVNGHPGYEDIYKQIINQGNVIGNHTYSHDYKTAYSSISNYNQDVNKLNSFLEGIGITRPTLMRFPGGSNNTISNNYGGKDIMNKLTKEEIKKGYQYIDWNVSSGDAEKMTESKDIIIDNVMRGSKGMKSIVILFHDSNPKTTTAQALPIIIKNLKERGYVFKTLSINSPIIHFK